METLNVQEADGIVHIQLQRPSCLNAVNQEMLQELTLLFDSLSTDTLVKGLLISGQENHFSAGSDLNEIRDFSPLEAIQFSEQGQNLCNMIESFPRPVLSAVSGYALGAGLELALACDYIIADATAQFAFRELSYGVLPAFGGTQRLPRLVGKAKAKEIVFTGGMVNADEALRIGLVNQLCEKDEMISVVHSQLVEICSYGLLAMQMGKEVIDTGYDINLNAACKMERDAFAVCFSTEDQKEGMNAFIGKRKPKFKGC
jgi:enoyl-CoA hydratase